MLAQAFGCGSNVQRLARVESRGGPQRSRGRKIPAVTVSRGVSGHFKMHHLWSLQSATLLTGGFLGFLGLFWQGVFLFP